MTADTVGGVWVYAMELLRALREYGIETALATMGAPLSTDQWKEVRQMPDLRVFESGFKLEWMDRPWHDVLCAGRWLLRIEEIVQPDLVHLNGYAHAALPWHVPKLVVGHSCVLSWWEAVRGGSAPSSYDRYRREVSLGLTAADAVVAPSGAMRAALRRHYKPIRSPKVVPNGRNPGFFPPGAKENFVMSVGRLWDTAKNAAALQSIAPHLKWPVYIAGEERGPRGLADAAFPNRQPHPGNLFRLGRLSSLGVASWLARASIYALPAYYEPFGLSVLEAGLSGCALVLGDIPSLRETWGDAAVFVNPGNTAALRGALEELIEDSARRTAMAVRARDRALEFTPKRMAKGYLEIYRGLMAEKGKSKEVSICG